MVSDIFDPGAWKPVEGFDFTDITYHRAVDTGAVRIAFDRPEVRNAFRPHTVDELYTALDHARVSSDVGCVLLTGNGPSPKDGGWAFCSGGDQRIRGRDGYRYAEGETAETIDPGRAGRLHILECQRLIRFMPKVVDRRRTGLGGRRRAQPARRVRPDDREPRARALQADRRRRSAASTAATGRPTSPARSGRSSRARSSSSATSTTRRPTHRMGMVNAVVPHAELEQVALRVGARDRRR